jgi:putative ABC transport system permease protein
MRSFLTMLGIIIGIAAIIAIVSTIKGTNDQIKQNLVGSGNNIVSINLNQGDWDVLPTDGYSMDGVPVIDDSIMEEILAQEGIADACKYHKANIYGEMCYKDNTIEGANLIGGDNKYLSLNGYVVCEGRNFLDSDFTEFKNVVILDRNAAYTMFQGEEVINQTIEIKGIPFTVIGIVDQSDDFEPVINSIDEWYTYYGDSSSGMVIIPDSVWPEVYAFDQPYQVIVKATSTEDMTAAGKNAQDVLNNYVESDSIQYKSEDTLEKAKQLQEISSSTNQQLIWIASISLLVGGIGVMNIMLVSVTERTREIGLKKALGARKRVILGQFLTEAAVLTSLGGILGVGAGVGLAYLISNLAQVPVAISVPAIVVSVVFSMVIGIVFGLIPSVKAANLNPIDALRYE